MLFKAFVQRGELNESIHTAKCLVKNSNFKTILSSGHSGNLVYPRSAIKIFQALPFINSGAPEKYFLNEKNLAISCASHCGELNQKNVLNGCSYGGGNGLKIKVFWRNFCQVTFFFIICEDVRK